MSTDASFPQRVKQAVLEAEPETEVYLFGSRARDDACAESDWDFLVLLNGPANEEKKHAVRRRVLDVELDAGETASLFFYSYDEWFSEDLRWTPFRENVRREAEAL